MNKMKVKKNDEVIVLKGKDQGKTGKVLRVNPEKRTVIVEKIKFAKEFIRRDQSKNIQGGIMEKESRPCVQRDALLFRVCTGCARKDKETRRRKQDQDLCQMRHKHGKELTRNKK